VKGKFSDGISRNQFNIHYVSNVDVYSISGPTFCRATQHVLKPIWDIAASFQDNVAVHSMESETQRRDSHKFNSCQLSASLVQYWKWKMSICASLCRNIQR